MGVSDNDPEPKIEEDLRDSGEEPGCARGDSRLIIPNEASIDTWNTGTYNGFVVFTIKLEIFLFFSFKIIFY